MAFSPKESGEFIATEAKHVKIQGDKIATIGDIIANEIKSGQLTSEKFTQNQYHPKADDPKALDWLFVVDTLNFCFWHVENEPGWVVDGKTGYFALCAALNRALRENDNILNAKFLSEVTSEQLSTILAGDTHVPVPLFNDRIKCLREIGKVLLEKFDGSFENCVREANNSAKKLLQLIVDNFECFKDEAIYRGKRVTIYKRAQILIGDIWACFKNKGIGNFDDIDDITMFADYRIPQSLLYYGVFEYSEELENTLKENVILENGSEMEVEIRGCSIQAVELIKEYVRGKLKDADSVNSILIDHFLWDFRREHAKEILAKGLPFHKTFSVYY